MVRDHKGNEFRTVDNMLNYYHINRNTYKARRRAGWTLKEALTLRPEKREGVKVDHLGNHYGTMLEMCEKYGIPENVFRWRMSSGWTLERALTTPNNGAKEPSIDHEGRYFDSLNEMLSYYKIPKDTYFKRLKSGWALKEILTTPPSSKNKRKFVVLGCPPMSLPSLIGYFNSCVKYNTLHKRIVSGIDIVTALICPDRIVDIRKTKTGVIYYSIQGLCGELTTRDMVCRYRPELLVIYNSLNPDNIGLFLEDCEVE